MSGALEHLGSLVAAKQEAETHGRYEYEQHSDQD